MRRFFQNMAKNWARRLLHTKTSLSKKRYGFAFHCAKSVESDQELDVVVIIVDSESLETRCRFWLENNND